MSVAKAAARAAAIQPIEVIEELTFDERHLREYRGTLEEFWEEFWREIRWNKGV